MRKFLSIWAVVFLVFNICQATERFISSAQEIRTALRNGSCFFDQNVLNEVKTYLAQEKLSEDDRKEFIRVVADWNTEHLGLKSLIKTAAHGDLYQSFLRKELTADKGSLQFRTVVAIAAGIISGVYAFWQGKNNEGYVKKHAFDAMVFAWACSLGVLIRNTWDELWTEAIDADSKIEDFEEAVSSVAQHLVDNGKLPDITNNPIS